MTTELKIVSSVLFLTVLCPVLAEPVPLQSTEMDMRAVSQVIADGPEIPHWERIDALSTLSKQIAQPELEKLFAFLRSISVPKGLQPPHVWALKNDLLNILREQTSPSQEYERVLFEIFQNENQDAVMRDYAVQHARPWYPLSANKPRILELLWSAARGKDGSLPGTAMLSLWGLWRDFPQDVSKEELAEASLAVASDPKMHIDARISCLQICGKMGEKAALPLALNVAGTGKPSQMRMSAIATIGDLGDAKQKALLESIQSGAAGDPGIQNAATRALSNIESRQ